MKVTGNLVAKLCNGQIGKDFIVNRICIDSRKIKEGDVFVAFKGQNSDGHEYISQAINKGATGIILTDPDHFIADKPMVLVDNAQNTIEKIARYKRENSKAKFIAVTGSVGKTSTKELLKIVFSAQGKTFATQGNYNNFLGMCITIASLEGDEEFVILEMGMDKKGEIAPLSVLARPDLSVITTVQPVHIANFNNIEEITLEKASIVDGMKEGSYCIINNNSLELESLKKYLHEKNIPYMTLGAEAKISSITDRNENIEVKAIIKEQNIHFYLNTHQHHQAENALMALLAVYALKLDPKNSIDNLKLFSSPEGRGQIIKKDKFTLIDDSYNANPMSMSLSLQYLSKMEGKKLAIIGDMRELGALSEKAHENLYREDICDKIDGFILCGPYMKFLWDKLPENKKVSYFENYHPLKQEVIELIKDYDIILVKSSLGTGLINISAELKSYV